MSVCGGELCQELIEFVLPALTLGPMAYQATSLEALKTDLPPVGASDITIALLADVNPHHKIPPALTQSDQVAGM